MESVLGNGDIDVRISDVSIRCKGMVSFMLRTLYPSALNYKTADGM